MAGILGIQEAMNLTEQQKAGGFVRDPKEPLSLHTLVKPLLDMTPDEQKARLDEVMQQYKPKDEKKIYEAGVLKGHFDSEPEKTEEKKDNLKIKNDKSENQEKLEIEKE